MKTDDAERILKFLAENLEEGKDFALNEAPELVQQLILWKRVESCLALLFVLFIAVIGACLCRYCRRRWRAELQRKDVVRSHTSECEWSVAMVSVGLATSLIVCVVLPCVVGEYLPVWIAPKVYVLQYAARLL